MTPKYERVQARKITLLEDERYYGKSAAMLGRATCGAHTRKGTPCRCLAMPNGRCKLHGGMSTGPRTTEGWARTRAGLAAYWNRMRAGKVPALNREIASE